MIQAKELRIGNLVLWQRNPQLQILTEITAVSTDWCYVNENNTDGSSYSKSFSEISPLRLTEEWLDKAGFIKSKRHNDDSMFGFIIRGCDFIHTVDNCKTFYSPCFNEPNIEFVHQVQNLFCIFFNTELTIEL